MSYRLMAASAAILLGGSAALAQSAGDPNSQQSEAEAGTEEIIEVAFDKDRYERMTVPVTISGKGPYRFFVDTGAQATVVTRRVTTDLSLEPRGKARLVAMGSSKVVDLIDIDELEFADRTLSGLRSPLLERQHIGADGILGLDTLQDMRVMIDFGEDRMLVADADALGGNYGYEIVVRARARLGQMIITDAKLDGVKTAVVIDTGAQNSVGNSALLEKLRKRERGSFSSMDVHGTSISGDIAVARLLRIGRLEMSDVPIGIHDSPAFKALGLENKPAVILGMRNLRLFDRVAIDFASRKVLFDLPPEAYRTQRNGKTRQNRS